MAKKKRGRARPAQPSPALNRSEIVLPAELEKVHQFVQTAYGYMEAKDWPAAVDFFQKALNFIPPGAEHLNVPILFGLGVSYMGLGRPEEGYRCFAPLAELEPDNHQIWLNLGVACIETNRMGQALRAFERCLRLKPPPDLARAIREDVKSLRKKVREQIKNMHSGMTMEEFIEIEDAFQRARYEFSNGRAEEAIPFLRRILELDDSFPQAWANLGLILMTLRRFNEAEEALLRALEVKPDFKPAQRWLKVCRRLNRERVLRVDSVMEAPLERTKAGILKPPGWRVAEEPKPQMSIEEARAAVLKPSDWGREMPGETEDLFDEEIEDIVRDIMGGLPEDVLGE
ncbi:MAG: tetratricopeptide repeat protein [Anaerolineae bacterium]